MGAICLNEKGCATCAHHKNDIEDPSRKVCTAKPNKMGFVGRDDLSDIAQYYLYKEMQKKSGR